MYVQKNGNFKFNFKSNLTEQFFIDCTNFSNHYNFLRYLKEFDELDIARNPRLSETFKRKIKEE